MRPLLRREPGSKEVLPEFWQEAGWANQLGGPIRRLFFPRLNLVIGASTHWLVEGLVLGFQCNRCLLRGL